jgi:hypothetical protein
MGDDKKVAEEKEENGIKVMPSVVHEDNIIKC